jgi:hypothetical protein
MSGRECDGMVKSNPLVSIVLVASLWLSWAGIAGAQTGWPDAQKPAAKASTSNAPAPRAAKAPAKTKRKPGPAKASSSPAAEPSESHPVDEAALRAMSAIIASQTAAIEALTRRVEATERRLAVMSHGSEIAAISVAEPIVESADLFRAALFVDWEEVIGGLPR